MLVLEWWRALRSGPKGRGRPARERARTGVPVACLAAVLAAAPSAEAGFGYRKPITIDGAQIAGGTHTDFPVLVSVVDPDLRTLVNGGRVRRAQGYDIEFRAADGVTVLDHEIETYDPASGRLSAWVRLPGTNPAGGPDTRVENGVNTTFYIYYGDESFRCARNNPKRVWLNGYRFVYHFNQLGAAEVPVDSTANGVTAVVNPGGQAGVTIFKGEMSDPMHGYGWDFAWTDTFQPSVPPGPFTSDTNSFVQALDGTLNANQPFTVETWFQLDTLDSGNFVGVTTKGRENGCSWVGIFKNGSDRLLLGMQDLGGCGTGGNVNHPTTLVAGRWYYAAVSFDGASTRRVFLHDAFAADTVTAATYPAITDNTRIGDDSNGRYLDGRVSEVRFSNVARSADWLSTQARSQACPSTSVPFGCAAGVQPITTAFLSAGAEQALGPAAGTLVNVTAASGLGLGGLKDGGLAFGDWNADGCLDALVNTDDDALAPDGQPFRSRLYLQTRSDNCTGSFSDVTQCLAPGLLAVRHTRSALFGDLNGDGRLDFVSNSTSPIEVYLNGGPGTTMGAGCGSGVAWSQFGIAGAPSQVIDDILIPSLNNEGLGLLDYDADGDLDLFFDNAVPEELRIFRNDGAGVLSAVAVAGLPTSGTGAVDYAAVADVDVDGRVDLISRTALLADLYWNQGGSFVAATPAELPDIASANDNKGGVAFCDLDDDGDFDLVWTDAPAAGTCESTSSCETQLWEQTGLGSRSFVSRGLVPGLAAHNVDGLACADLDHDGRLDLVLTGHTRGFVFRNQGGFSFADVSPASFGAAGGAKNGEGVAVGDHDRDGDLDVLLNLGDAVAQPNELWRNETNDVFYLAVRALTGGRDAIGATASLYSCAGARVSGVREVSGGMGHGSQGPLAMHFALPRLGSPAGPASVYEVRVQFVGGAVVRKAVQPASLGCYQQVSVSSADADDLSTCLTTAVRLVAFEAHGADGAVDLSWRTGAEVDNLGFHLHRATAPGGPWTRLTSSLVPGQGFSATGASYGWRDPGLENGVRYYYQLEDVDARSGSTIHGPVEAVPQAAAAARTRRESTRACASCPQRAGEPCPAWVRAALGSSAYACETHGDSFASSFQVLRRSARETVLELRSSGFVTARDAAGRVRALIPGFEMLADPRDPALPLRRALLDGVVGRRARIRSVRAEELQRFPGLVPATVGHPQAVVSADGTVRAGRREAAPPAAARGLLPRELARLAREGFQGERKTIELELTPLRYDPARSGLLLARRLVVSLAHAEREPGERGRGARGRRRPRPRRESEAQAFLATTRTGLHAVTFEAVFPGRGRGIDPAALRLTRERGELGVPFHVQPAGRPFGPGSRLYFHADRLPDSSSFSPEVVYALEAEAGGPRMAVVPAGAGEGLPLVSSRGLSRWETNRHYLPSLLEAEDLWQWEPVWGGTSRTLDFSLAGLDHAAGERARLVVHLQGGSDADSVVDHSVQVLVNGAVVGGARFDGAVPYRVELELDPQLLVEGQNALTLSNLGDTGVTSLVFLDRFELLHPQTGAARAGVFQGVFTSAGNAHVSGLAAPVALLDLTASTWLLGDETGGAVRFRARAGHDYLAVSREALLAPRVFFPRGARLTRAQNRADYILIAPEAFLDAAEPLLAWRRAQRLETMAASLEEIASAFGGGEPSAEAIRAFLSFAWHSWRSPSPRYVVLLGDASYDPRRFQPGSSPSPLPFLTRKTSYLWTVSDPALAAVNGDDALPDLAIGRLPATTLAEARALVGKLLDWERQGLGLEGRVALVADNPDPAGDFEANQRDVERSFLAGRETTRVFLGELGSAERARGEILGALDDGLSLISYAGHGGGAVWASENMLSSFDAQALRAQPRQPLMLTLNCLNGYFITPHYDSLAEAFLKAEGRGTIAAFSPSGLSLDAPAHLFHRAVMAELTAGRHERLGDAILAAQRAYALSGAMPELLSVYHLLADPATSLR